MPRFKVGNVLDCLEDKQAIILVTTNASVTADGNLVMGKGAAKQLADKFPGTASFFGKLLIEEGKNQIANRLRPIPLDRKPYLTRYRTLPDDRTIGIFQVKRCWWENADKDLVVGSTKVLTTHAALSASIEFHLNYPGIGFGNLTKKIVAPILEILPDNVVVWELP